MSGEIIIDPHPDDVLSMAIRQRDAARYERDKAYRERAQLIFWSGDAQKAAIRTAYAAAVAAVTPGEVSG